MGQDIRFNFQEAKEKGLTTFKQKNGTSVDVYIAKHDPYADEDYINWLRSESDLVLIPDTTIIAYIELDYPFAFVTANGWGRIYNPLTHWLMVNNIEITIV